MTAFGAGIDEARFRSDRLSRNRIERVHRSDFNYRKTSPESLQPQVMKRNIPTPVRPAAGCRLPIRSNPLTLPRCDTTGAFWLSGGLPTSSHASPDVCPSPLPPVTTTGRPSDAGRERPHVAARLTCSEIVIVAPEARRSRIAGFVAFLLDHIEESAAGGAPAPSTVVNRDGDRPSQPSAFAVAVSGDRARPVSNRRRAGHGMVNSGTRNIGSM